MLASALADNPTFSDLEANGLSSATEWKAFISKRSESGMWFMNRCTEEKTHVGAKPAVLQQLDTFQRKHTRLEDRLRNTPADYARILLRSSLWEDPQGRRILHTSNPTERLLTELSRRSVRFVDPDFPASSQSLGAARFGKADKEVSSWRRPAELSYIPALFSDAECSGHVGGTDLTRLNTAAETVGASALCDSIVQGSLGDCWLLAAIASVASIDGRANDTLIREMFSPPSYNPFGFYSVRLRVDGEDRWVVVDDLIPCYETDGHGGVDIDGTPVGTVFSHSRDGREVWVMMLEKAFAKLHGSYIQLRGSAPDACGSAAAMAYISGGIEDTQSKKTISITTSCFARPRS
jgi:hypothetical protein